MPDHGHKRREAVRDPASLEIEAERGALPAEESTAAASELRSLFELFQDDEALDLFAMKEPADAALAGESFSSQQLGIADQRLEAWFKPFEGTAATGIWRRPATRLSRTTKPRRITPAKNARATPGSCRGR